MSRPNIQPVAIGSQGWADLKREKHKRKVRAVCWTAAVIYLVVVTVAMTFL